MTDMLVYQPPTTDEWNQLLQVVNAVVTTDFVPKQMRGNKGAVMASILTGRELGIGPMQSLREIHVISGRPTFAAALMVARVRAAGHRFRTLKSTDDHATVQIHRKGEPEPEPAVTFTMADAQRAQLAGKDIWRQYPVAMLWSRAASAACRRDCSEVLGPALYTPEEVASIPADQADTSVEWGQPESSESSEGAGAFRSPPVGSAVNAGPAPSDPTSTTSTTSTTSGAAATPTRGRGSRAEASGWSPGAAAPDSLLEARGASASGTSTTHRAPAPVADAPDTNALPQRGTIPPADLHPRGGRRAAADGPAEAPSGEPQTPPTDRRSSDEAPTVPAGPTKAEQTQRNQRREYLKHEFNWTPQQAAERLGAKDDKAGARLLALPDEQWDQMVARLEQLWQTGGTA